MKTQLPPALFSSTCDDGDSLCLDSNSLGRQAHICAFFQSADEEYEVLLPYIRKGLELGQKAVHTIDPRRLEEHSRRLTTAGIPVTELRRSGQMDIRDWSAAHLKGGDFDATRTLALFAEVLQDSIEQGFPLTRFLSHMEWFLETKLDPTILLEYEAVTNRIWMEATGPVHPVVCTYDLRRFRGDIIVDVIRTHPLVIMGGILQTNPFFVPPDEFLREIRARRGKAHSDSKQRL